MIHNVRFVQSRSNFSTTEEKSKIFPKIYQKSATFHAMCDAFCKRITFLSSNFVTQHSHLWKALKGCGIGDQNKQYNGKVIRKRQISISSLNLKGVATLESLKDHNLHITLIRTLKRKQRICRLWLLKRLGLQELNVTYCGQRWGFIECFLPLLLNPA